MVLTYDDEGSGPAVLLIHSGVCDRRMWRAQSEVLARTHRVVAPDLAGFGASPLKPGRISNSEDVVELLDKLGIERTAVVGSSFGGRVALELTLVAPDRVSSLVLLCSGYAGLDPTPTVEAFGEEEERLLEAGDVEGAVELKVSTWVGPDDADAGRELGRQMQRRAFEVQIPADAWPAPPDLAREDPDLAAIAV